MFRGVRGLLLLLGVMLEGFALAGNRSIGMMDSMEYARVRRGSDSGRRVVSISICSLPFSIRVCRAVSGFIAARNSAGSLWRARRTIL